MPSNTQTPMSRGRITGRVISVLSAWNEELEKLLISEADKNGLVLTGALRESFDTLVKAEEGELRANLELYFQTYGRFSDIKYKYHGKTPPLQDLLEFVQKVGVQKFHYIPGYEGKVVAIGATRAKYPKTAAKNTPEMRIAWGLKMSYKPGNRKSVADQPKAWYNRTVNAQIRVLKDRLRDVMAAQLADDIKDSFNPQ